MASPFTAAPAIIAATDAQIGFIANLLGEREWNNADAQPAKHIERAAQVRTAIDWARNPMSDETPAEVSRAIHDTVGRGAAYGERVNAILDDKPLTKSGASAMIEWLLGLPQAAKAAPVELNPDHPLADEVPAGRYAVDTEDGAINATAFYKVDRPTEGRWAGYVFVKHIVSDDEIAVRGPAKANVLAKIAAAGAEAASARYGHEIGECGVCGRQLTNDDSRERGIGPVCADKMGW